MNIWACDKSLSIRALLLVLAQDAQLSQLSYSLTEDANSDAIRLNDERLPGLSAYVYCYGQRSEHYGLDLEYPAIPDEIGFQIERYEEVTLSRAILMLGVHFELCLREPE